MHVCTGHLGGVQPKVAPQHTLAGRLLLPEGCASSEKTWLHVSRPRGQFEVDALLAAPTPVLTSLATSTRGGSAANSSLRGEVP